jgi:hypothetical protein
MVTVSVIVVLQRCKAVVARRIARVPEDFRRWNRVTAGRIG